MTPEDLTVLSESEKRTIELLRRLREASPRQQNVRAVELTDEEKRAVKEICE